jgi:DNA-binding transcriptional MerR regulator
MKTLKEVLAGFSKRDLQNLLVANRWLMKNGYSLEDAEKFLDEYSKEQRALAAIYNVPKKKKKRKLTKEEALARKRMLKETVYGRVKPRP